jgi:isocitrate dehydrogenase kinase/phosphatase
VMSVFTLPSYPYVFKVIRDRIAATKDASLDAVRDLPVLARYFETKLVLNYRNGSDWFRLESRKLFEPRSWSLPR